MRDILNKLDIISETPEAVRDEITTKVEKIPDEGDLKDILKFTNRYSIKKDVFSFADARKYKDIVSNTLLKALSDAEIPEDEVRKFLDKLSTSGILNAKALLTPSTIHSIDQIVDQKFRSIFDKIKSPLYGEISGKIGEMGDVGKGEYLLDIMSPDVNRRGAPGDLDVNGTKVELKAGENGRLGPAGSMSLAGRFQREFVPVLNKLMPEKAGEPLVPKEFNPKLDMSVFSAYFDSADKVKEALDYMLKMHYPNYNTRSIVDKVVDSAGNIDGRVLKAEMLKASFTEYKKEKDFDGIIIMDGDITKFLYIGTPEDMVNSANLLTVAFPSWTDTQSNAMKVTLAKGRASTAKSKTDARASAERQADIDQKIQDIAQRTTTSPEVAKPRAVREPSAPRAKRSTKG